MTSNDPDQIRREIEETRANLSHNVNDLGETVSPSNVAQRQKDKVAHKVGDVKDRIMGSASDVKQSVTSGTDQSSTGGPAQSAQDLPDAAKRQASGNPLAVGLIALGAGWLLGSLLPASEAERQAAEAVQEKAQPLLDQAKTAGQDIAQNLKEPAQQAGQEVKQSAQGSAETVKGEGQSTAADVKESGQQARDNVQASSQSEG